MSIVSDLLKPDVSITSYIGIKKLENMCNSTILALKVKAFLIYIIVLYQSSQHDKYSAP